MPQKSVCCTRKPIHVEKTSYDLHKKWILFKYDRDINYEFKMYVYVAIVIINDKRITISYKITNIRTHAHKSNEFKDFISVYG